MFRCWITDYDVRCIREDLGKALWKDRALWPPDGNGIDGIISSPNDDKSQATFSSATGNFSHVKDGQTEVPVNTLIVIAGVGIFKVASVTNNTSMVIVNDTNDPTMAATFEEGTGKRYSVGGYADKIKFAYDEMWHDCGTTTYYNQQNDPLDLYANSGELVDKALYVPDGFHGANQAMKLGALSWILLSVMRNNESSYKDIYDEIFALYEARRNSLMMPYDFDESGSIDASEAQSTIRLIR